MFLGHHFLYYTSLEVVILHVALPCNFVLGKRLLKYLQGDIKPHELFFLILIWCCPPEGLLTCASISAFLTPSHFPVN